MEIYLQKSPILVNRIRVRMVDRVAVIVTKTLPVLVLLDTQVIGVNRVSILRFNALNKLVERDKTGIKHQ